MTTVASQRVSATVLKLWSMHGGSLVEATEHVLFLNISEGRQDLGSCQDKYPVIINQAQETLQLLAIQRAAGN
jgi:hypothetical protein